MSLKLEGDVVAVIDRKYAKVTTDRDGKIHQIGEIYGRLYQMQTVVNEDGYVKIVDVDDFDLKRKVELGHFTLPVYVNIYSPVDKEGKKNGESRIQFHAIKEKNVEVDQHKQFKK
jgi:hypothetical protein